MNPVYFRITEQSNSDIFYEGWREIPPTQDPFYLNRNLWWTTDVSRSDEQCAVIRFDLQDKVWQIKNRAPGRMIIMNDGRSRFELRTSMTLELTAPRWVGTLTEAFTFEIVHERPTSGSILSREPGPDRRPAPSDRTAPRMLAERAQAWLADNEHPRRVLAYLWREHIEHTTDMAQDVSTPAVAAAFAETNKMVTEWRAGFARRVYGEATHQHVIRDLVIKHGLLTSADVAEADHWIARRRRALQIEPMTAKRKLDGKNHQ